MGVFQYTPSGFCWAFSGLFFMHIAHRRWLFWEWKYDTNTYRWVQQRGGGGCRKEPEGTLHGGYDLDYEGNLLN